MWKDEWFAIDFGLADATPGSGTHHLVGKAEPLEDGWENSPWEDLLNDLIHDGSA